VWELGGDGAVMKDVTKRRISRNIEIGFYESYSDSFQAKAFHNGFKVFIILELKIIIIKIITIIFIIISLIKQIYLDNFIQF